MGPRGTVLHVASFAGLACLFGMVFLFDIDGTLLQGHGVGRRAVERALREVAGRDVDTQAVEFSGKTDPQIFREIAETLLADAEGRAVPDLLRLYEAAMTETLPSARLDALPGAVDAVARTRAAGLPTGLLTGNLRPMAFGKVARIGLTEQHFPFGAYGCDHPDRNALPAVAAARAATVLGRAVPTEELVVIGDTPRDIACARAVGAVAVAVATGRYPARDLQDADVVLPSLDALDPEALAHRA